MKIIIRIIAIFLSILTTNAFGYNYEKKLVNSHVIHILHINPNNGNIGRETVSSMAQKSSADIAINAGFFEIGGNKDGVPSGTLVIHGKAYNLKKVTQPLVIIKNSVISINRSIPINDEQYATSIVSGIPMLINDKKVCEDLYDKKSNFYIQPHARTALGLKADGTVVVVLVEHYYTKDLTTITMGELQSLIKINGERFVEKYKKQTLGDITLNELKQILRDEFAPQRVGSEGLKILELASLMQDLGCDYAINLDGGGSSTLWIDGKVINNTFGDKDEAIGKKIERPVSDAIIFKKRR
jgi:exopolysaccharide biosynthesis protein